MAGMPYPPTVCRPIGFRPPSDWIPSAVRSDSVRRLIRFRPPPDQIPSAVWSEIVMRKQTLHPLKTYELTHIIGQKLINLMLKVGLYYNIDYFCN